MTESEMRIVQVRDLLKQAGHDLSEQNLEMALYRLDGARLILQSERNNGKSHKACAG